MNALVIDDEPRARSALRQLLKPHPHITIVGEAGTVTEGRAQLASADYEVVFLDIQLIGGTGFDLVPDIKPGARVIFVTAMDQHALRAFEVNALDYLLKPVLPKRLADCLERLAKLPRTAPPTRLMPTDQIRVSTNTSQRFVAVAEISAVFSNENYSDLCLVTGERFCVRQTMKAWEERLPEEQFVRLHRQAFANLAHVTQLRCDTLRRRWVHLRGLSEPLAASRRQWRELDERIVTPVRQAAATSAT
jgi:two-component system LytT family response regulator